jgi:hypothetical protein
MKGVRFGDEDEYGKKLTCIEVSGSDCEDAKTVIKEIRDIVKNAVQEYNPTAYTDHLVRFNVVEADCVKADVCGYFVDAFVAAGYEIM